MTKNKSTTLNMSLIPLFLLIALILGAGYLLIQGEIKLPKFNKGPQIRRLEGFPTIVYTEKELDKQRQVVKSEEELINFLNFVDESGLVTVRENIDLKRSSYLLFQPKLKKELCLRTRLVASQPSFASSPQINISN